MGKKNNSETEDGDSERLRELGFVFTDRLLELGVDFCDIETTLKDCNRLDRIVEIIQGIGVTHYFASEEVESTTCYPTEYRPRSIPDQIARLCELFPELDQGRSVADIELAGRPLPRGAEGYFAIPRWEVIASTYHEAVERVLSQIYDGRVYIHRGFIDSNRLRQYEHTVTMLKKLGDQQEGCSILIVPAQFGLRHRGRSVRRAREVFRANEFDLGISAVGSMLLTHPERLGRFSDLMLECGGDEYDEPGDGVHFSNALYFSRYSETVELDRTWLGSKSANFGSATGFVPS